MSVSYWRRRDQYYRLLGVKCEDCGAEYYPPVYVCRRCGGERFSEVEMPRTGRILTYTILYEPMAGFRDQVPLTYAIVELDNGVRVLGQVVDNLDGSISVGDRVRVVFRRVRVNGEDGQIYYGYKFTRIVEG